MCMKRRNVSTCKCIIIELNIFHIHALKEYLNSSTRPTNAHW